MLGNRKYYFLIILAFFCFKFKAKAQTYAKEQIAEQIFHHIYNQEFELAKQELNRQDLNIFSREWLRCELLWWENVSINDKNTHVQLEKFLVKKTKISDNSTEEEKILFLLHKNYSLRLKAMDNKKLSVINLFLQINGLIKEIDNKSLSPLEKNFYEIYTAVFAISKNKYKLFSSDDIDKISIEVLKKHAVSFNRILRTLSQYFLLKIYLDIKDDYQKAKVYAVQLHEEYPDNQIFIRILTMINNTLSLGESE